MRITGDRCGDRVERSHAGPAGGQLGAEQNGVMPRRRDLLHEAARDTSPGW
jgi:hypothetical protein